MRKSNLVILAVLCCMVVVAMPATRNAVAGVSEKVAKAQATLRHEPSMKRQVKAVRSLGEANDCERDCDCSKSTATAELVRLADTCNGPVAAAARKELRRDLRRSETSVTRQRVEAFGARGD